MRYVDECGAVLTVFPHSACKRIKGHQGDCSNTAVGLPPAKKIYIAAPYELRDAAISLKQILEVCGYEVTAKWLVDIDQDDDATARKDLADVARADVLLLLNPEAYRRSGTGGRHCEFMYAWALGKEVVVLGVRSNIFHHLSNVRVIEQIGEL